MITITRTFRFSMPGKWSVEYDTSCVTFEQTSGEVIDPADPIVLVAQFESEACMNAFTGKLVKYNEYGNRCAEYPLDYSGLCDQQATVTINLDGTDFVIEDTTPDVLYRTWKFDLGLLRYVDGDSHSRTIRLAPLQPFDFTVVRLSQVLSNGCTTETQVFLDSSLFSVDITDAVLVEVPDVKAVSCEGCKQGVSFITTSIGTVGSIDVEGLPAGACYEFDKASQTIIWTGDVALEGTFQVTVKCWSEDNQMLATDVVSLTFYVCTSADPVTYQQTQVVLSCGTLDTNNRVDSRIRQQTAGEVDWSTFQVVSAPAWVNVVITPDHIFLEANSLPSGTTMDELVWKVNDIYGRTWKFTTPLKALVDGPLTYPPTIEMCPVCGNLTDPIDLRQGITPAIENPDMVFTGDPDVVAVPVGDEWAFYIKDINSSLNPVVYYKAYRNDGCLDTGTGGIVLHPVCVGIPKGIKDLTCEGNKQLNLLDLVTLSAYHPLQTYTFAEETTGYTDQGGTISTGGDVDFTGMQPGLYIFRITAQRTDYPCTPPATHSVTVSVLLNSLSPFPYDNIGQALLLPWPTGNYETSVIHLEGYCPKYDRATDSGVALPSGWSGGPDMWAKFTKGGTDKEIKVSSVGLSNPATGIQAAIYDVMLNEVATAAGTDTVTFNTASLALATNNTYLLRVLPTSVGALKITIQ